jgi:hypothetical protein
MEFHCNVSNLWRNKKRKPDDLNQEIAQNYTDNSGLAKLYASLQNIDFKFKNRIN